MRIGYFGHTAGCVAIAALACLCGKGTIEPGQNPQALHSAVAQQPAQEASSPAEAELQTGIALTRKGRFGEAIPHFLAAQGHVSDEYAVEFNLALCYVGENQADLAIQILSQLRNGHETASVENLLAQAYAEKGYVKEAFEAVKKASVLAPKEEKLYLYVGEAFLKRHDLGSSLKVIEAGLGDLPNSARLHYERGFLLEQLEETDMAKTEFEHTTKLAPHSALGDLAAVQGNLMMGNLSESITLARAGIRQGHSDYQLLAVLGEALLRAGASPGQAEFLEAKECLEKSIAARPNYASSQVSLGHVFLLQGHGEAAIAHLESGRQLDPQNPAVYPLLAAAYRQVGHLERAQQMLTILAGLNQEKVQQIRSAPGDMRAIPGASSAANTAPKP